jgi:hypothetical protein
MQGTVRGSGTSMVGKVGRVTGTVGPGLVGEVMVSVRGGVEAFYAAPVNPEETIPVGATVLVVEYRPPRDVLVSRL